MENHATKDIYRIIYRLPFFELFFDFEAFDLDALVWVCFADLEDLDLDLDVDLDLDLDLDFEELLLDLDLELELLLVEDLELEDLLLDDLDLELFDSELPPSSRVQNILSVKST